MAIDPNDAVNIPPTSTGPRTDEGKSRSSRNSLKFGLFTAHDFIRQGEEEEHAKILTSLMSELAPEGASEEIFAIEIVGATWRLRRCRLIEEAFGRIENLDVDPMIDERTEKQQKSVDRARAQSHLILRRSLAELRKLQKGRGATTVPEPKPGEKIFALSYYNPQEGGPPYEIVYSDGRHWREGDPPMEPTPPTETTPPAAGSFCNPAPKTHPATRPIPADFPRNAQCPCRSGQKYKRCCGKDAPPVLNRAA
jgi:hypothetical protein